MVIVVNKLKDVVVVVDVFGVMGMCSNYEFMILFIVVCMVVDDVINMFNLNDRVRYLCFLFFFLVSFLLKKCENIFVINI